MTTKDLLIDYLKQSHIINSTIEFCKINNIPHDSKFVGMLQSLASSKIIKICTIKLNKIILTSEGEEIIKRGSPEYLLFNAFENEITKEEIIKLPFYKYGFNEAMKRKWIHIKDGKIIKLVKSITDEIQKSLNLIVNGKELSKTEEIIFKKRKLIKNINITDYSVEQGENLFSKTIKEYNLNTLGLIPKSGSIHPLQKVKENIHSIFLSLGFEEMETNMYVESSFWNFDSLFIPQQHPARNMQDTFFISDPAFTSDNDMEKEYMEKVKSVHEKVGYSYNEEEAKKNILRT